MKKQRISQLFLVFHLLVSTIKTSPDVSYSFNQIPIFVNHYIETIYNQKSIYLPPYVTLSNNTVTKSATDSLNSDSCDSQFHTKRYELFIVRSVRIVKPLQCYSHFNYSISSIHVRYIKHQSRSDDFPLFSI